ncbi:hypothetical protein [Geotalea sp. SG265]|uniref:hypothetical protein n=1 Tax=Geotalea sp. SG265 TaxID=2922867 RepID=UPI001FAF5C0A|nr:hypothetical protein [Geotalea sp. SG265]
MKSKGVKNLVVMILLLLPLMVVGCSGSGNGSTGTVIVFTDVHFNPFYDPTLFPALNAADAGQWAGIFRTSAITAPSAWGADTNYPLLALALSSIKQNRGGSPFIIFTGDILGHYLPQQFYKQINGTTSPRNDADVAAMKAFTDKTMSFFMQQVRGAAGDTPVLFALGNADSYTGLGPDSSFLAATAELYYTQFVNGAVDHQAFTESFTSGGYYAAEPKGTNLMVIGLNTFEFSPSNAYFTTATTGPAVAAELAWLDTTLASAQAKGKKVWLLMHVPPGVDIYSTARTVDVDGHITSAVLMWDQGYQATFLQILAKYPGLVTQTFAAHTHMDEYRIISSDNVAVTTPSIAPYFGDNPAYRIFTFSHETLKASDYTSLNYDLATMPGQFGSYYTFSMAYLMQGGLNDSLSKLYPLLHSDSSKQQLYRGYYFSGHDYTVPSGAMSYPITDKTWPVYWCGAGHVDEQGFIGCVNSY